MDGDEMATKNGIKWRQNGDKMAKKCDKNGVKMATKCDKNWVKMAKMGSK